MPRAPFVGAADKALQVLSTFSREESQLGVTEISRRLNMDKGNVHRLLATLERRGFVRRVGQRGRYAVGPKAFEIGSVFATSNPLVEIAGPVLENLATEAHATAQVSVLNGTSALCIALYESPLPVRVVSRIGSRLPLHASASGKALLMQMPDEWIENWLATGPLPAYTPRTVTEPGQLWSQIREAQGRGYATQAEEYYLGTCSAAAPVERLPGADPAAIVLSSPTALAVPVDVERLGQLVMRGAMEIAHGLGVIRASA